MKKPDPTEEVQRWLDEIKDAKKRESDFRKDGERVLKIYGAEKNETTPFNILFSNTETLLPALYSAVPRPVVNRRFKDEDPMGKASATAGQRALEFLLDTNVDGYETFDDALNHCVLDALLPGRGIATVKYDAKVEDEEGMERKTWETVCCETRSWDRVYFGYAKKWSKVPWIAYEEYIDRDEAERLFGIETASKLKFSEGEDGDDEGEHRQSPGQNLGGKKTTLIYQIWDKDGGRVIRWVSPGYGDGVLKTDPDPLQLTGFFNCPRPMTFIAKSNDLVPVAMYKMYENQAEELNRLTQRIKTVVGALRARGIYDSELGDDLDRLMKEGDAILIPSDKTSSLAAEKGLQNAIWFMPVDVLMATLTQLYQAREQCKRVIYEITGISDILRGSTVASETATAQGIKAQWGTMRLKRLQKEVQRYARDVLRMMLEIAGTKFSEETWAGMTGLPFLTTDQRQQAEQMAQALQMAQAQGAQVPPETQQQVQQALSAPVWGQVLNLLQNDLQRAYRIDIETNSTVEPEAVEDQKNIAELMNALAQYLNGVGPLVAKGVMPMEVAQSMLLAITRRFRFGTDIEDYIKQMKAPPPEDDGKAAEAQQKQAEQQRQQVEQQMEMQKMQAENQMKMLELKAEMQLENVRLQAQHEAELARLEAQAAIDSAKVSAQKQIEQMKAQIQRDTELKKAAMAGAVQIEIAKIGAQVQAATAAQQAEQSAGEDEAESERGAQSDAMLAAVLQTQERLLATLAAPKVGTLSNGKKITIETKE
ncbi:hypothetical protein K0U83_02405 [bacterium]|nr:hypothetical protein [bacterium]